MTMSCRWRGRGRGRGRTQELDVAVAGHERATQGPKVDITLKGKSGKRVRTYLSDEQIRLKYHRSHPSGHRAARSEARQEAEA